MWLRRAAVAVGAAAAVVLGSMPAADAAGDPRHLAVGFVKIAQGLAAPVGITAARDGHGRLFVAEQGGAVRVFANGRLLSTPLLDVSARSGFVSSGEQGLVGIAAHPDYVHYPYLWLAYTLSDGTGGNKLRISRFKAASNTATTLPLSSEVVLLEVPHPRYTNHNGGQLMFGRDSMLYIGTGDGGGAGDPNDNARDRTSLSGKILRVDAISAACKQPYCIPSSNPYASSSTFRKEIWLYGLRNPFRFSRDRQTGNLWIGDVGQDSREEVDVVSYGVSGRHLGWPCREGTRTYDASRCSPAPQVNPTWDYGHDLGESVIGGFVYRGTAYPAMQGVYLYSDYYSGRVWALRYAVNRQVGYLKGIASYGEDERGELYAVSQASGALYRVKGVYR